MLLSSDSYKNRRITHRGRHLLSQGNLSTHLEGFFEAISTWRQIRSLNMKLLHKSRELVSFRFRLYCLMLASRNSVYENTDGISGVDRTKQGAHVETQ